jgi:hypothetical protein
VRKTNIMFQPAPKTHRLLKDRHIRAVEIGDCFEFAGRERVVKSIERKRNEGKVVTFEDGYMIDSNLPRYDNTTVDVVRGPLAKFLDRPAATSTKQSNAA